MSAATAPLVVADGVSVTYPGKRGQPPLRAVDEVSLTIATGETLGLVGESGCGKSTLGRAVAGLRPVSNGRVTIDGLAVGDRKTSAQLRRRVQMIFQDPYGSLDPRMRIGATVAEPLVAQRLARGDALKDRVAELLEMVGLRPEMGTRYPHEFSGGQRQRIAIARALASTPKVVICDEPISALDVSIQAQVLNLLADLRREHGLTYLFIAHDLAVVRRISTRVAVMYLGRIVEMGPHERIFAQPAHPYTAALISAVPQPPRSSTHRPVQRIVLHGDVPSPASPPTGCTFHTRCWLYEKLARPEICRTTAPPLTSVGSEQLAACHFSGHLDGSEDSAPRLAAEAPTGG